MDFDVKPKMKVTSSLKGSINEAMHICAHLCFAHRWIHLRSIHHLAAFVEAFGMGIASFVKSDTQINLCTHFNGRFKISFVYRLLSTTASKSFHKHHNLHASPRRSQYESISSSSYNQSLDGKQRISETLLIEK